jgi:hypothetical protein
LTRKKETHRFYQKKRWVLPDSRFEQRAEL